MNKLPERIRIKDIARLADVSVGTVDRVIHSRSGVSEASKKRVEEILKQLDYQPNMYASALASNKAPMTHPESLALAVRGYYRELRT